MFEVIQGMYARRQDLFGRDALRQALPKRVRTEITHLETETLKLAFASRRGILGGLGLARQGTRLNPTVLQSQWPTTAKF